MRRFSGGDPTLHKKISGDAREGCRTIGRVVRPAILCTQAIHCRSGKVGRDRRRTGGVAGISAVLARVEGLLAELSTCRECADRECSPAARARGGAPLPALSGPLTFVAARRSTGDKVTCDTPGRWQAAMTR